MSLGRVAAVTLAAVVSLVGAAAPTEAQSSEAPSNAPVHVGPLALSPAVRLTNFGHDSNVYNRDLNNNPKGDVTATLSPTVDAWLRLPHARMNGRSQFDFYYFKQLTELRALDTDSKAHVELVLNRLAPFVEGTLKNTRQSQNLEIDAIARRRNDGVKPGADLRLTAKVSVGAYAQRSRVHYEPNSLYLATDLARVLNHKSSGEGAAVRWALTPYTTFAVDMSRQRDRFDFAADRNADSVQVTPSVEFKPQALVSGRASVGFGRRRFLTAGVPEFNGIVAFADLYYTLLERTRFAVEVRRNLEYSYLVVARDYLATEVTASVTERLGDSWDAGGSLGRARLTYPQKSTPTNLETAGNPAETVLTSVVDVGYNIGRTRVGFHLEHRARQTDRGALNRGYHRLRIGSTLTYAF